jgi:hypothetical protein
MAHRVSKYAPLEQFLANQAADSVAMTFAQIERIIHAPLPPVAFKHRAWWSNNPSNSVMTQAWRRAGFESEQVDMDKRRLVFRRAATAPSRAYPADDAKQPMVADGSQGTTMQQRHPLLGALKGLLRVGAGTDLTQPADPDWAPK